MMTYFPQPRDDRALLEVILIFSRYFYRERSEDSLDICRVHRYLQGGGDRRVERIQKTFTQMNYWFAISPWPFA